MDFEWRNIKTEYKEQIQRRQNPEHLYTTECIALIIVHLKSKKKNPKANFISNEFFLFLTNSNYIKITIDNSKGRKYIVVSMFKDSVVYKRLRINVYQRLKQHLR